MVFRAIILCITLMVINIVNAGDIFNVEIEKALGSAGQDKRIMWRGNASKLKTLLLYEGDSIELAFCLSTKTTVAVTGVRYSNDGILDNVTLSMDGRYIGHFETKAFTWWGHQWNNFTDTGPIGFPMSMHAGNHVLNISILESDNYGLELDSIGIELKPENSNESFLCLSAMKEHVAFTRVFSVPNMHVTVSDNDTRPRIVQRSKPTSCVDESNVQICFDATYLIGMQVTALSEYLNNTGLGNAWDILYKKAEKCYDNHKTVWQLGVNDNNNAEFGDSRPSLTLEFQIDDIISNIALYPRVVYPTLTGSITLRFSIPLIDLQNYPFAIFTFALVNPDRIPVSLEYYNPFRRIWPEKDERMLSGIVREAKWYIPTEELSASFPNTIRLTFSGAVAPVNVDYLKLDVGKRETAYPTRSIFRNRMLDIRGVKSLSGSRNGMAVRTIFQLRPKLLEQFSIMARKGRLSNFAKIMTLHSDGRVFLHTMAERMPLINEYPDNLGEASGITLRPNNKDTIFIKDVIIDPIKLTLNLTFSDGSKSMFKIAAVSDETKMILLNITIDGQSTDSFICYDSKFLSSTLAAVNGLTIDEKQRYGVMSNIDGMRGKSFWFDHEFAPWFVQVGSDIVIDFP